MSDKVRDIILPCEVLHNVALDNQVPFDVLSPDEPILCSPTLSEGCQTETGPHPAVLKCEC